MGLGSLFGGLFGSSGDPYKEAMKQYQQWADKTQQVQQPYLNAGNQAIGDYQYWLQGQEDPAQFINNLMGQYQESPHARYLQNQSLNAGQNAASASGLMGSTPLMRELQQNSTNIASQDQNQWLQNLLGINTQYGQGQGNLINSGQNSANSLSNMYQNMGQNMSQGAFGKKSGQQQDLWDTIGFASKFLPMFF